VTFKDLQKVVQAEAEHHNISTSVDLVDKLRGLAFWIFDQNQHRLEYRRTKAECCFWHSIKCPQKDNHDMPVLTISENIIRSATELQTDSHPQKQRHRLQ
jgi:hypothetical protein